MLATFLTLKGFAVRQAHSGDEGLEYFRNRGPFACVISDFQMYGETIRDGVDMLKAIRTEAPKPEMHPSIGQLESRRVALDQRFRRHSDFAQALQVERFAGGTSKAGVISEST